MNNENDVDCTTTTTMAIAATDDNPDSKMNLKAGTDVGGDEKKNMKYHKESNVKKNQAMISDDYKEIALLMSKLDKEVKVFARKSMKPLIESIPKQDGLNEIWKTLASDVTSSSTRNVPTNDSNYSATSTTSNLNEQQNNINIRPNYNVHKRHHNNLSNETRTLSDDMFDDERPNDDNEDDDLIFL